MKSTDLDITAYRTAEYPVMDLMINRWSPRAFSNEEISVDELMSLFEAARWSPSCFNSQPWRFFFARRGDAHWQETVELMGTFNQQWAGKASALIVIFSRKTFEHNEKPSHTHAFDTGAAWMSLNLQAASRGLIVHGMAGFDYEKARQFLNLPDHFEVIAMAAIGHAGDPADLPEKMREREVPSGRKPVAEIIFNEPLGS